MVSSGRSSSPTLMVSRPSSFLALSVLKALSTSAFLAISSRANAKARRWHATRRGVDPQGFDMGR